MSTDSVAYVRDQFDELIKRWSDPDPSGKTSIVDALFIFRLILGRSPDLETELPHIQWNADNKTLGEFMSDILASHEFSGRAGFMPANRRFMAEVEGFRFWFNTSDREMGARMALDLYEPETIAFFRNIVRPGMTCFDIGAQTGFITCLLAQLVGPKGKVVAFEPNPPSFELLSKNILENGTGDYVTAVNVACSDSKGVIPMTVASGMFVADAHAADAKLIQCVSLDDEALPAPDIVKIDVEGHEPAVLRGIKRILATHKPIILMELNSYWLSHNSNTNGGEIIKYMNKHDYVVSMMETPEKPLNWRTFTQSTMDNCNVIAAPRNPIVK